MLKNKKMLLIIIIGVIAVAGVVVYMLFLKPEPPIVYSYYSPGEAFVTNVKETGRLFKSGLVLVVDTEDEKVTGDFTLRNALIRDTIIFILRDLSEEEILAPDNKEALRQEIISQLNTRLETEHIVDMYFNDYVVQ
ncbi:MAG: flagellar basal body-associated FliL family protein [Oscillospiraceae bacterium]|jgi:flagellar basal body-associated protein FliL|nr:flagellar basal body-associated FliL family protein [Oscillospiraceae bacterium]